MIKSDKTAYILPLFIFLFLLASCKEKPPFIDFEKSSKLKDTSYMLSEVPDAQTKNVLLEDFTGVRCPNCPAAQDVAKDLSSTYEGRIITIAIHPLSILSSLTRPFINPPDKHQSKYDFRTKAADVIFEHVGILSFLPVGAINRTLFNGESNITIPSQKWPAAVNEELTKTTPVNIQVSAAVVDTSIIATVKITYTQNISESHLVSIMLVENGLVDVQEKLDPNAGVIYLPEYEHNHILRAPFTKPLGEQITVPLVRGRYIEKSFAIKYNPAWIKNNLKVVAFVNNATTKVIVHVKEVNVQ